MTEEQRLIRIEDKIDKFIETNGVINSEQNERLARVEATQKIVSGLTLSALGAAFAALIKAFFLGSTV